MYLNKHSSLHTEKFVLSNKHYWVF